MAPRTLHHRLAGAQTSYSEIFGATPSQMRVRLFDAKYARTAAGMACVLAQGEARAGSAG